MHPTPEPTARAPLRRNPSRAGTARNSLAHGLRARSLTPVAALGETQAVLDAHLAAYRREFPAPGPYARDLAEAVACASSAPPAPSSSRPSSWPAPPRRPATSPARHARRLGAGPALPPRGRAEREACTPGAGGVGPRPRRRPAAR